MAKILLTSDFKMSKFNTPHQSRHQLIYSKELGHPWNKGFKFIPGIETFVIQMPRQQDYQMIHSFCKIPYTQKPWVVTFEQLLPRPYGGSSNIFFRLARERLALDNCKRIIAMSNYAKNKFIELNKDWNLLDKTLEKLCIIPPNLPLSNSEAKTYTSGEPLQLIFVGSHFARKGGIVALRVAEKLQRRGIPNVVHLVSKLIYGAKVYTDHTDSKRYEKDLKLLKLPNVVLYDQMSNREVLNLLSRSHFQIMPTLDDTYGFSIIEGFSVATPAITTNVCALPEIVDHGQNGYLLELPLNETKNWSYRDFYFESKDKASQSRRSSDEYWEILDNTYEVLSEKAVEFITKIIDQPEKYQKLSQGAISQARNVHDSQKANELLDNLYSEIINEK